MDFPKELVLLSFLLICTSVIPIKSEELRGVRVERLRSPRSITNSVENDRGLKTGDDEQTEDIPEMMDSTSRDECLNTAANSNGKSLCCTQYTWPGHVLNPQLPSSKAAWNCTQVLDQQDKDSNMICRDPIAYANATTGRPDPELVSDKCDADGHECFCAASSCLTYVIYETTIGEPRKYEVHFCGSLRRIDGTAISSGCYRERRNGTIHEVCACNDRPFCNGSNPMIWTFSLISILSILISMLL